MPTYEFVGAIGRVFADYRNGVDGVLVQPAEGAPPAPGTTVLLEPGDVLTSDAPIVHPELREMTAPVAPKGRVVVSPPEVPAPSA